VLLGMNYEKRAKKQVARRRPEALMLIVCDLESNLAVSKEFSLLDWIILEVA